MNPWHTEFRLPSRQRGPVEKFMDAMIVVLCLANLAALALLHWMTRL